MNALLSVNADYAAEIDLGISALQRASISGHVQIVKRLLSAGAPVNSHAKVASALSCATFRGHLQVVNVLLDAGADVNIQDEVGCTPLHLAAKDGHFEIVKRLLEANADVNMQDAGLQTALFWAAWGGHGAITKLLVEADANVNVRNNYGQTALHMAASGGHNQVVIELLEANADVWLQDQHGWTSLHHASNCGHFDVVQSLLASKRTSNQHVLDTGTSLTLQGQYETKSGPNKDIRKVEGMHKIQVKTAEDKNEVAPLNSNLNARYKDSIDPHLPPWNGRSVATARTDKGVRAIHLAVSHGHYQIANILVAADREDGVATPKTTERNPRVEKFGDRNISDSPIVLQIGTNDLNFPVEENQNSITAKMQVYNYLVSVYPTDHFFRKDLADVYSAAGRYTLAVSSFEIALTLDPLSARATCVAEIVHRNNCDSCNSKRIKGYRHKCTLCPDYDLCNDCFNTDPRPHLKHDFMTIPSKEWRSK